MDEQQPLKLNKCRTVTYGEETVIRESPQGQFELIGVSPYRKYDEVFLLRLRDAITMILGK